MALILGLKNTTTQTVPINGLINLGTVYRKNCKRTRSGLPTYVANGNSVTLNGTGFYHITATAVGSGTAAGVLTAQLYENGVAIPGAISSSTITTANTERDYRYDSRYDAERYYTPYDMGGEYTRQRGRYMDDYATEDLMGEYRKDLRKWADKLKRKDRFNIPKEEIIEQAKKMGVSFDKYDEEEFYTIYLMHISDYPEIANDYYTYVAMAKKWLEDDDIEVSPSEKVCIYMYDIVMGEED